MFDLANRIAYDGAMVYGTLAPSPVKETPACLPTGWVHASGRSSGNWVDSEGKVLERLLAMLDGDGVPLDSIAVITPFQDVRNQLKDRLPAKIVRGTIHTMQGKEAAVIILVLGGSSENGGAREWAVSKPNLLNVAVTRAKRRLYVIGDRNDWAQRKLFCEVMELIPAHPRMTAAGLAGCQARKRKTTFGGLTQSTSASQHLVELRHDSPTNPCRGLGRNLLARIRAQRVPRVSPVGSGNEYDRRSG